MGKRQHQKDKMYITYTEWTTLYGGKRSGTSKEEDTSFKRLPYDHCCLCLQPFDEPYCDLDGNVFELVAIADFVKKFKVNPVSGKKFDVKSLIKLKFHNNSEGNHHCPVLFKPFTKNSHIVAIRTSGNVYSYEAVDELNVKGKNWKDLIDDTPFVRSDIITIQDPNNLGKFNISTFHHVKNNLRVETEEEIAMKKDPHARLKSVSAETREILKQLEKDYKSPDKVEDKKEVADKFNAAHYSTGMVAASFTSTAMAPEMVHEAAIIHEDDVIYDRVKKKGYVRIMTNYGPLNFELYCDVTPKACHNFIKHCNNGYYNGTKFHRSIRNFMIQGGDPTGTGLGGESVWKKPFEDEIRPNLHHTGRGILAMANSGPNTNGSQFFITFRSCKQLDGKHTIFGKLVGGIDTLNLMEQIEVDNKDRPVHDIVLEVAQVFVDPFAEAEELVVKSRQHAKQDSLADDPNRSHRAGAQSSSRRDRDRREPTSPVRQRPHSSSWQSKPPHHTFRRSRSPEQKRWHPKATSFKRHSKSPPHRVRRSRSPYFRAKRSRSPLPKVHRSRSPRSKPPRSRSPRSKHTRSRSPFLPRSRSPRSRVKRSYSPDFKDSQQRTVKRAKPSQSHDSENVNVPKNRSRSPQYLQPKSSSRDHSVKETALAKSSETLTSGLPVTSVSKENSTVSQSKKNYADQLLEMLNLKVARGEQLHLYYYSKMFLLGVCEIKGRHAVDCLTAGIEDSELRSEVERNEFTEPEQVLTYFKNVKSQSKHVIDAICDKNADQPRNLNVKCWNCHGVGHQASLCPAPQLKCTNCKFQGHTVENCPIATNTSQSVKNNINRACSNCNEVGHTVSECLKQVNNYQNVVNKYKFTRFQQAIHYSDYIDCQNSVKEFANSFSTSDGFVTDNFQNVKDMTLGHNAIKNCNEKSKYCFQCQILHPKGKCPKQKICFKCNKVGHLRNHCTIQNEVCDSNVLTLKDGTSKNKKCFICGKLGHSRFQCRNSKLLDCTTPIKNLTENVAFKNSICSNCKEPGHRHYQCPQPKIKCTNCKKMGHSGSDCKIPKISPVGDPENVVEQIITENVSGVKASKKNCYNCKEIGHMFNQCPQPKLMCTNCKRMGHLVADCIRPEISPVGDPENVVEQIITVNVTGVKASKMSCFNCKEFGHKFNQCPQPRLMCTNCKKKGHLVSDCNRPKTSHCTGDSENVVEQIITENVGDVEASSSNKIEQNNTTSIDNMKDSVC